MNMNPKEKWIEERMNADSFIERVAPSEELIGRLKAIPSLVNSTYEKVPKKIVWAVAASIAILICVNLISLNKYDSAVKQNTSSNEVSDSYFSYLKQL